ncbi:MAG TPA: hypothetical protein VGX78_11155 [Pirellulales bacterium]|jgi:DNA-directed RNA polymerase subunit RPC12/RpoP|nr:hypothetical protein [Pirellulales bacterium]
MSSAQDPSQYVRVTCPVCKAVLHPRVERAGRHVKCPDCYSPVLVPQPVKPQPLKPRRDPGEYAVAGSGVAAKPIETKCFPVLCPTCSARLHPLVSHVGKRVKCPDCDVVFVVPAPPPPPVIKPLPTPGQYGVGTEPQRAEAPMEYLMVQGTMPAELPAPPPTRYWFVSGVFNFPWAPGAWNRWLALSMLAVPAAEMVVVTVMLTRAFGPYVVPLSVTILVWLWLWTLSYAAACFVVIVQDTGSGDDGVCNWHEGDWRERIWPLLFVAFQLALAAGAASLVALPVGRAWGQIWGLATTVSVTAAILPILLLSSMEADEPFIPYSPVILRSMLQQCLAWFVIYLEGAAVLAAALAIAAGTVFLNPFLGALVACPVGATAIFILARLIGRLAWRIGEQQANAKGGKKRRKKPREEVASLEGHR